MLEATVTLNLKRMLLTEAGLHHVEKHMEQEFSKENLISLDPDIIFVAPCGFNHRGHEEVRTAPLVAQPQGST